MGAILTRCPDSVRHADDVIGCGYEFAAAPDHEGLVDCPQCGMFFAPEPLPIIIHTSKRKSGQPRGAIQRGERIIGWAVQHSRVAAGMKGERAVFFTATPNNFGGWSRSPSSGGLGTRYRTRHDAVAAVVEFDRVVREKAAACALDAGKVAATLLREGWTPTVRDF